MGEQPTPERGSKYLLFPNIETARVARDKIQAVETDPDVRWRVIEKSGRIVVAAYVGRDFFDVL